jgi:translocation protein SEC72
MQRAPWEAQQLLREELSTVLSNRSAAHFENGDLVSAITDADAVIQLKKPWSKGHFRKAKALIALGLLPQAKEAVQYGLQFDPTNAVNSLLLRGLYTSADVVPTGDDWCSPGHRICLA